MKKGRKVRYWLMLLMVALSFSIFTVRAETASYAYSPDAAVAYAKANWNVDDGTVCDQFVKNCLHAGGATLRAGGVDPVMNALIDAGFGTLCEIKLADGDAGGRVKEADNPGVKAGDIFVFYCEDCDESVHMVLISGYDENGYMQSYGHNPAWEKVEWFGNYVHEAEDGAKHTNYKYYAVKMDTGIRGHMHDFGISSPDELEAPQKYETEHPHKMYDKCANCDVKYYLGWNAKVSSCHICNPSPNGKPILNVKAEEVNGQTAIKLSWTAIDQVNSYEVWRAKNLNGTYFKLGEVTAASFTNLKGEAGVTYYYKVVAVRREAGNVESDVVSITWPGELVMEAPVLENIRKTDADNPRIGWNSISGAVKYEVHRREAGRGSFSRIYTTQYRTYTNSKIEAGKTYEYKVRAEFADGNYGEFSNVVTIKCAGEESAVPIVKNIRKTDTDKPRLGWTSVEGAIKYRVYRRKSGTQKWTFYSTLYNTYTHLSAEQGVTYEYEVTAVFEEDVESPRSNRVIIDN